MRVSRSYCTRPNGLERDDSNGQRGPVCIRISTMTSALDEDAPTPRGDHWDLRQCRSLCEVCHGNFGSFFSLIFYEPRLEKKKERSLQKANGVPCRVLLLCVLFYSV
jgi:hypothetical protein